MSKSFIIYNPRSEAFTHTSNLREFVAGVNQSAWDVVVSDIVKSERFLGLSDAACLLNLEEPFDGDDGYMVAFSVLSHLSDFGLNYSVAFNEESGSWGVLVECYELRFHEVLLGSVVRDKETGEQIFTKEIEDICSSLDRAIDSIIAGE